MGLCCRGRNALGNAELREVARTRRCGERATDVALFHRLCSVFLSVLCAVLLLYLSLFLCFVGKVKRAVNESTGEVVAIKIISKELLRKKPSLRRKIQREIAVMKMMRSHPNVIDFYELYETDGHLLLVVEYCPHGELFDRLITRGCFPPEEALDIFQQVIHGLKYCHKRLICHRDIKPENLLLAPNNVVKLVDFGLATMAVGNLLETACGSAHYASPEIISGESYDGYLSDVWSCGVLLFALLTGSLPFDDDNFSRLLAKVQAAKLTLPPSIPSEVRSLLLGMLTANPRSRLTLEEVMAHPWFTSQRPRLVVFYDVPDPFMSAESAANSVPVRDPNPVYLGHLRALGWGETSVLKRKLAQVEHSLERECYRTFERHYEQQEDKRRVNRDVAGLESQLANVELVPSS